MLCLAASFPVLTNFGVSFCILSHPTGVIGSFATAWFWGGPVTATWGWMLVSLMICGFVGPAMAEICSAYPTAGGLYYWAAKLGGKHGRFASWITGWFNMLGQSALLPPPPGCSRRALTSSPRVRPLPSCHHLQRGHGRHVRAHH